MWSILANFSSQSCCYSCCVLTQLDCGSENLFLHKNWMTANGLGVSNIGEISSDHQNSFKKNILQFLSNLEFSIFVKVWLKLGNLYRSSILPNKCCLFKWI